MIRNIIFDFGGVLLDLDYNKTFEALGSLMNLELSYDKLPAELSEVCLSFERGEFQYETFMWKIQKLSKLQITQPHLIIKAWNAMLLGWNSERLPWLLELKQKYNTYLLSNTNSLHIDWVRKDLKSKYGITDFEATYFDCVHYSHEMGMQKPNLDIYEEVILTHDLIPSESVFIDDNLENIEAARKTGLLAIHHDPKTEIIEMLPRYLSLLNF